MCSYAALQVPHRLILTALNIASSRKQVGWWTLKARSHRRELLRQDITSSGIFQFQAMRVTTAKWVMLKCDWASLAVGELNFMIQLGILDYPQEAKWPTSADSMYCTHDGLLKIPRLFKIPV